MISILISSYSFDTENNSSYTPTIKNNAISIV
jgi:hypothetical protein